MRKYTFNWMWSTTLVVMTFFFSRFSRSCGPSDTMLVGPSLLNCLLVLGETAKAFLSVSLTPQWGHTFICDLRHWLMHVKRNTHDKIAVYWILFPFLGWEFRKRWTVDRNPYLIALVIIPSFSSALMSIRPFFTIDTLLSFETQIVVSRTSPASVLCIWLSRPARHKLFPSKLKSCCRWDHKRWQPLIRNLWFDQMLATSSFLQNQIALEIGSYRMTTFDSTICK